MLPLFFISTALIWMSPQAPTPGPECTEVLPRTSKAPPEDRGVNAIRDLITSGIPANTLKQLAEIAGPQVSWTLSSATGVDRKPTYPPAEQPNAHSSNHIFEISFKVKGQPARIILSTSTLEFDPPARGPRSGPTSQTPRARAPLHWVRDIRFELPADHPRMRQAFQAAQRSFIPLAQIRDLQTATAWASDTQIRRTGDTDLNRVAVCSIGFHSIETLSVPRHEAQVLEALRNAQAFIEELSR